MTEDRQTERTFLLLDLAVVVAAMGLAFLIRERLAPVISFLKPSAVTTREHVLILLVFVPTWAWCADRVSLYRIRVLTGPLIDLIRALLWTQAWGTLAIASILVAAQLNLNRSFIGLFLVLSTLGLSAAALLERTLVRARRGRVLALLVAEPGEVDAGVLEDVSGEIERLRGRAVERLSNANAAALGKRLRLGGVDEVVILGDARRPKYRELLEVCEEAGIPSLVRLDRIDLNLARPKAEVIGPTLYLAYHTRELDRPALLVKSILDRLLAAMALVFLLPVLLLIAILVRVTSPGPALFRQDRGGLNGRPFRMLKFRTMRLGAEAEREALLPENEMDGPVFKLAEDPRVTRFGRFLRRTSLDELPQLVNVLLGHMSLVGPRPLPRIETEELTGIHRRRLSVRPGITCLWQVSGRNDLTFQEWMALDLQYIDNWSLGLDLAILMRTLPAILSARGAK